MQTVLLFCSQRVNVEAVKYIVVENGNIRQLQVANVSAADEGVYSCRVQNKQSTAKLLVARKFSSSLQIYKQLYAAILTIGCWPYQEQRTVHFL